MEGAAETHVLLVVFLKMEHLIQEVVVEVAELLMVQKLLVALAVLELSLFGMPFVKCAQQVSTTTRQASPYALTVQWGAIHQPPTHQHAYHALLDDTVINQVKHPAQAVL